MRVLVLSADLRALLLHCTLWQDKHRFKRSAKHLREGELAHTITTPIFFTQSLPQQNLKCCIILAKLFHFSSYTSINK